MQFPNFTQIAFPKRKKKIRSKYVVLLHKKQKNEAGAGRGWRVKGILFLKTGHLTPCYVLMEKIQERKKDRYINDSGDSGKSLRR